jgi:hypothetical protein
MFLYGGEATLIIQPECILFQTWYHTYLKPAEFGCLMIHDARCALWRAYVLAVYILHKARGARGTFQQGALPRSHFFGAQDSHAKEPSFVPEFKWRCASSPRRARQ